MATRDKRYRGYSINTGKHKTQPCNIKTLNQIIDRLKYMNDKHSKVLAIRIDIMNDKDIPYGIQRHDITRILDNLNCITGVKKVHDILNVPYRTRFHQE